MVEDDKQNPFHKELAVMKNSTKIGTFSPKNKTVQLTDGVVRLGEQIFENVQGKKGENITECSILTDVVFRENETIFYNDNYRRLDLNNCYYYYESAVKANTLRNIERNVNFSIKVAYGKFAKMGDRVLVYMNGSKRPFIIGGTPLTPRLIHTKYAVEMQDGTVVSSHSVGRSAGFVINSKDNHYSPWARSQNLYLTENDFYKAYKLKREACSLDEGRMQGIEAVLSNGKDGDKVKTIRDIKEYQKIRKNKFSR